MTRALSSRSPAGHSIGRKRSRVWKPAARAVSAAVAEAMPVKVGGACHIGKPMRRSDWNNSFIWLFETQVNCGNGIMDAAYFVIAILGCGDGAAACTPVATVPTHYANR